MRQRWKVAIGITAGAISGSGLFGWWYADRTIVAEAARHEGIEALQNQHDYPRAEERLTLAIRKFPEDSQDSVTAYVFRGMARSQMGRSEDAIADFSRAIEINPNSPAAKRHLGIEQYKMGRYSKAKLGLEDSLLLAPSPEAVAEHHYYLGLIAEREGDLNSALAHHDIAAAQNTVSGKAFAARSRVSRQLGHFANADKYRAEAIKLDPQVSFEIE